MKRIIRLNASALSKSSCSLHLYYAVIGGYKEGVNGNHIEFGSAIHVFTRLMYETNGDIGTAMLAAKKYYETTPMNIVSTKKYLTSLHLMKVLPALWEWYQEQSRFDVLSTADGKPAVEITFSNKIYEDEDFIVLLEGTIDKLGKFEGQYGAFAIGDWKSTSSWKSDEYLSAYKLSTQLRFYWYNLHLHAKQNPGSFLDEIVNKPIGAFIDGIFLNGEDKIKFERSEVFFFKEQEMQEFERLLMGRVAHILSILRSDAIPLREGIINGACNGIYGRCKYFNVCAQPDDIARAHILKNNYIQAEYLPLRNSEEKV